MVTIDVFFRYLYEQPRALERAQERRGETGT